MTCTSKPRCTPISAAISPTGPAPVTTTRCGAQRARRPMRSMCSQALASTLAVAGVGQLAIGAADAEGKRAHEDRALALGRLGNVLQALGARLAGLEGYGAHIGVTTGRRH